AWLTSTHRVRYLLIFQGGLSVGFSGLSLVSWFFQTVRPYQQTLAELKTYGVERSFDLQILTLRNWHPVGHQNYVAGYLLLALPLLAGLAFAHRGWQRIAWLGGFVLGWVTLYSTASRGSWFGLMASFAVFIGLSAWQFPKLRRALVGGGLVGFGAIALWGVSSDRIRPLFTSLFQQNADGAASYRLITNATGWYMGQDHPIFGAGLGSVALLYQKYRPAWAGTEAELTYQLHSTPAQLWAELGIAGVLLTVATLMAIVFVSWRCCKNSLLVDDAAMPSPLTIGVISGLAGYGVYAVTDYQLDNICISGTLIIFVATLIFSSRCDSETTLLLPSRSLSKRVALAIAGILAAVSLLLYPVHRAWMLSSQGFLALGQNDFASFVTYLTKAHELAPWEAYYPYQLAWNLGELAYQSEDVQQQETLRQESVDWFEKANAISPHQEFGYANLGWLLVNSEPQKAAAAFLKAGQLIPDKQGNYFALGYSLLKQGDVDLATQAMVAALVRQPILLTSPVWLSEELIELYPQVVSKFEAYLRTLEKAEGSKTSKSKLYQLMGTIHWWKGEYDLASKAFSHVETDLNQALMALADTRPGEAAAAEVSDRLKTNVAINAWVNSKVDKTLLLEAFLLKNPEATRLETDYFTALASDIQSSLSASPSFHDWLTQAAPSRQQRTQRLGFGTISRHIDGPLPKDFSSISENILATDFLAALFPVPDR
ncbi:MAG: O-antigen ligase family protein, partial [Phormidesmis sp.]